MDGVRDGCVVGWLVGAVDGRRVGSFVGMSAGLVLGRCDGAFVGTWVGASVRALIVGATRVDKAGSLGSVVGAVDGTVVGA